MKRKKKFKSDKEMYAYYRNLPRGKWELILDRHNHKLEFVRTVGNVLSGIGGLLAILKIFNII